MPEKCKLIHPYGKHVGAQCDRMAVQNGFCNTHSAYQNGQCQSMISQGLKKGTRCFRPAMSGSVNCGKHCPKPKKMPVEKSKTCCEARILAGPRKGQQCSNNIKGTTSRYCGKHRDLYELRNYVATVSGKLCGGGLRCKNIVTGEKKHCEECLGRDRLFDNTCYKEKADDTSCCIVCGMTTIEFAKTKTGKESRHCLACYTKMRKVEDGRKRTCAIRGFANPIKYYESYKSDAAKKKRTFDLEYTDFVRIVSQPCHYCGKYKETEFNGVDRVDSSLGYNKENCVPACKLCNLFKSAYTTSEFVNHCKAITKYQTLKTVSDLRLIWKGKNKCSYKQYKGVVARRRDLEFTISEKEYIDLKQGQCYLCGGLATSDCLNGIDCIDSSKGYVTDNVKSCCPCCNKMKLNHDMSTFIDQCLKITEFNKS